MEQLRVQTYYIDTLATNINYYCEFGKIASSVSSVFSPLTEGTDYTISHPEPLLLVSEPVPVTVRLLNDRVAGEDFDTIILTLHQDEDLSPSNIDQILLYPTVQITIQDNDRTFTNCYNYSACPHLATLPKLPLSIGTNIMICMTLIRFGPAS